MSNLTGFVSGSSPSLQVSAVIVPQTRPRPLPSTSFPSQQSLLMAESLSKYRFKDVFGTIDFTGLRGLQLLTFFRPLVTCESLRI